MYPTIPNRNHDINGLSEAAVDFLVRKGTWRVDYDPRTTRNQSRGAPDSAVICGEGPVDMEQVLSFMNVNPWGIFRMDTSRFDHTAVQIGTNDMHAMIDAWGSIYGGTNVPLPWGLLQSRPDEGVRVTSAAGQLPNRGVIG